MIPLHHQKGFYYTLIDSKVPEKEQLQDLGPQGPAVTQESQGERSKFPRLTHAIIQLSPPKSSPNKLNILYVSNFPSLVLSLCLLQLGLHLSCSAETAFVKVINSLHVAESNGAYLVYIILHESIDLPMITHFLSIRCTFFTWLLRHKTLYVSWLAFLALLLDSSFPPNSYHQSIWVLGLGLFSLQVFQTSEF